MPYVYQILDPTERSVSAVQNSGKKVLVSSGMVLVIADLPVSAKSQADGLQEGKTLVEKLFNL